MKTLIKKNWEYVLYKEEQKYLLEVVCGTSAIFEITIALNKEEVEGYLSDGEDYISQLAERIRNSPNQFSDRKIV
ncbi:MAG: hypothetical protein E2590_16470 [Chryseobacterium sp.]|nr:hypothetical protein [Chryseobacterium sp.]